MNFFGNFGLKQVGNVNDALTRLCVAFDPETAGEAQIATVADAVKDLNSRLADYQIQFDKASAKLKADQAVLDQHMHAAEALSGQNNDKAAQEVLDIIENKLNPQLQTDQQDFDSIKACMGEVEGRRDEMVKKLSTAKSRIETAKHDLDMAKIQEERAKDREQDQARTAGLLSSVGNLDAASDALSQAADAARKRAKEHELNAQSFGSLAPGASTNPDIAAALAAAAGATPKGSVADRLAALKAQQAK